MSEYEVRRSAAELLLQNHTRARWQPLPHQIPPQGRWGGWLLMAGRGSGKTDACAKYIVDHVNGPACMPGPVPHWIGVIAPTLGDAVTSCVNGPSGIRAHDRSATLRQTVGGTVIRWPNGSEAKLFGASTPEDVERLRAGGNRCLAWLEELAAWRYLGDCWDHMKFGLRLGQHPHWIASTTPKPKPFIIQLAEGKIYPNIAFTRATTYDNPHLSQEWRADLTSRYEGTTLGQQELLGQLLDQDEDALWTRELLNDHRVGEVPGDLTAVAVGVDPSGGAGEQGIVVVGKRSVVLRDDQGKPTRDLHGYVLADRSCRTSPAGWGRRAVQAAIDFEADAIVVETNYGGEMAQATVQGAADDLGVSVPIRVVNASRGKRVRAEPVAALAERGRWHHVGTFEHLETQMCTWTTESGYSPDRLDAMVWPPWYLKMVGAPMQSVGSFGGKGMSRRIA